MHSELHVDPNICCNTKFPNFGRPKIIGFIGLENLKFAQKICEGNVEFNLNLHLDRAIRKPVGLDVKLTDLVKFLLEYEADLNIELVNKLENSQFFCYRGLMTLIACTPYEKREPWKIVVILFKGNIYLCARDTDEKIKRKNNMTEKEKRFTSWGYKFEQFVLSDTPNCKPNPNVPVNETEEFSLVFTTHLNQHRIVYGAEMDGIQCDKGSILAPPTAEHGFQSIINYLADKEFIELKTNRHIEFPNQEASFRRFKAKKWWCQSFLAGVDTILCGFRNDDGIVEELKLYHVKTLPKMSQKYWNSNICFNFLDTFFTYVKRCLAREIRHKFGQEKINDLQKLPMISLLLEWNPGGPVRVTENYSHTDDPILPEWFLNNYGNIRL